MVPDVAIKPQRNPSSHFKPVCGRRAHEWGGIEEFYFLFVGFFRRHLLFGFKRSYIFRIHLQYARLLVMLRTLLQARCRQPSDGKLLVVLETEVFFHGKQIVLDRPMMVAQRFVTVMQLILILNNVSG